MHHLIQKVSLLLLTCPVMVVGQTVKGNYSPLPLKDLSSFESSSANWSVQGNISILPAGAAKVKTQNGEGVLLGNAGNALTTKLKASDLRLYAEFNVSPGAEGSLILPGGQKVRISDSSKQQGSASASTSGYVGQFPTQNAAKAPGLWQTIELSYDASVPNLANSARLNSLALNGVTVLETVYLPNSKTTGDGQPISLEVTKGSIAFRNIGYQLLASRKPLALANLNYKVYSDKWDSKEYSKIDHEGKSAILTQEVTNGMREFHLVYEGDLDVTEAGEYIFTTIYSGPVFSLDVDGKSIIAAGESTSQESHTGSVNLSQGKHQFKIHYSRFPWRQPALGLRVEKAGIRPYDLHVLSSLPEPEPKPYISVTPDMRPEMVRSFILLNGEKYKRTHCISVGSPDGWNYTVDLNRGALIQAWRGKFADVTEMWYERGEPQLLFPAGLKVHVSGRSSLAVLDDAGKAWPDSSNINFLGYKINAQGYPVFRYAIGSATVSDALTSGGSSLSRTFTVEGNANGPLYSLLASGKQIVEIEKGLYQVDDRYYVQTDKKVKVIIRPVGEVKELILPVSGTTSYSMFW
ncbi:MAG: family 16 glycoside hydrolase [Dyadobacter sp.]|uniref:family 16 glycoside hydrolase n=1 Tax=Dyadobacter sp. TaxID=1914288 RepID=UPI0032678384